MHEKISVLYFRDGVLRVKSRAGFLTNSVFCAKARTFQNVYWQTSNQISHGCSRWQLCRVSRLWVSYKQLLLSELRNHGLLVSTSISNHNPERLIFKLKC